MKETLFNSHKPLRLLRGDEGKTSNLFSGEKKLHTKFDTLILGLAKSRTPGGFQLPTCETRLSAMSNVLTVKLNSKRGKSFWQVSDLL